MTEAERYVCIKPLWLQSYDDDGFTIENTGKSIDVGEIWTVEKRERNMIASNDAIRLVRRYAWIEIQQETLNSHFILRGGQNA